MQCRGILLWSCHLMYFRQSSIVPVLVTLTLSNLGEVQKKKKQANKEPDVSNKY